MRRRQSTIVGTPCATALEQCLNANGWHEPRWALPSLARSLTVAVLIMTFAGCAQPPVDPNSIADSAFTHYLATVPVVTVDEGSRAVLLLVGSTDQWPTPEDRRAELIRRGAFKDEWNLDAGQRLDFGTLGYMLRVTSGAPRGVNEVILGPMGMGARRYALRTCAYENILPYRLENAPVSGGELLSALTAAEDYMARKDRTGP